MQRDTSDPLGEVAPQNPLVSEDAAIAMNTLLARKHPRSICVANYKGGVGKTTLVSLLGYYFAERTGKRVLVVDIDPQCSLSLALGFEPEEVAKTSLTIVDLLKPTKWDKLGKTDLEASMPFRHAIATPPKGSA